MMLIMFTPYPDADVDHIGDMCEEIQLTDEDDRILDVVWEEIRKEKEEMS